MDLCCSYYIVSGLSLVILSFLVGRCYKTFKIYSKFPMLHLFNVWIDYHVKVKVPKDIPFNAFAFQNLFQRCQKFNGEGLVMIYLLRPILIILGEEATKVFLNEKVAGDKPKEYKFLEQIFGPGLITRFQLKDTTNACSPTEAKHRFQLKDTTNACSPTEAKHSNGERWRKHRKMLNPSFQFRMLKERVPLFNEHAEALVKDLETLADTASTDPLNVIKSHYFNALKESVFGLKRCEENKDENLNYFHLVDSIGSIGIYLYTQPWLQWKISSYISPSHRKFRRVQNELFTFTKKREIAVKQNQLFNQSIQRTDTFQPFHIFVSLGFYIYREDLIIITEMEKLISTDETKNSEYFGKNMRKSLTYILLQHRLNDPSFTFEDLHAEVTTFMAAGYDTVSYSTMWCLFLLGLHPEVQEKAFNEVNSLTQDYISYEDSCNFTYLESVIMETLRLYPTVPLFGRQTTEDVHFGKYIVPKETYIAFFPYLWHRNPATYPDPEKFDPERFLNEGLRNSWTHIPFAEGNRTCIGKKYALIEMKIFLAHILRNYKIISLDKREDIVLCYNLVLMPSKPLRMLITSRSKP